MRNEWNRRRFVGRAAVVAGAAAMAPALSTCGDRFHHQGVGDLTLAFAGLEMAAQPGLTLTIYSAQPGSPSEEGLRLLASWAATQDAPVPVRPGTGVAPAGPEA
ncbi:twin-arginine translocation signal domain-containing protein [Streptomyces sp. NBC_00882]|nr:twin-arginine translocation signal domain-containing protein [Streptomyces sp. NBC_00882]WSZ61747.1 twin-arginine translocation signal domain-containing protein [Streptomyces canus]